MLILHGHRERIKLVVRVVIMVVFFIHHYCRCHIVFEFLICKLSGRQSVRCLIIDFDEVCSAARNKQEKEEGGSECYQNYRPVSKGILINANL